MKRTILAVLIAVIVATPCFAQEVETDGLFSIEGTKWEALFGLGIMVEPFIPIPFFGPIEFSIGFYDGIIYLEDNRADRSFYQDMLVASFFGYEDQQRCGPVGFCQSRGFGILQPLGMGVMFSHESGSFLPSVVGMMALLKADDNWKPLMTISISPDEGEQGTTLTDVRIYGTNTTFQSNPPVEISFNPPDGLTVSNINVISNISIEFDLEIAVDAPTGARSLTVTYDNGKQSVSRGGYAFRVNERTN